MLHITRPFFVEKKQPHIVLSPSPTTSSQMPVISEYMLTTPHPSSLSNVMRALVIAILLLSSSVLAQRSWNALREMPVAPAAASISESATTLAATTAPAQPQPSTPGSVPASVPVPACAPIGQNDLAVSTRGYSPGLHILAEDPRVYTVHGSTTEHIQQQIQTCGPLLNDGHRYAASTGYSINWTFTQQPLTPESTQCRVANPIVVVRTQQTLPTWQRPQDAPVVTTASWQRFITNLKHHEDGHTERNIAAARSIYGQLNAIPAAPCATIQTTVTAVITNELAALKTQNSAYDRDTNHGISQGTIL